MVRIIAGHGFLTTRMPPCPFGTSWPASSTIAAMMPGSGSVHDPGTSGGDAGQRRDHVAAGFRLPERVDDRAAPAADRVVVPHPGFRIDRLAHGAEQTQARQVVVVRRRRGIGVRRLDQRADRRGRGVEDADLVILDHLPEAARIRVRRHAFEHDFGRAHGERSVQRCTCARSPSRCRRCTRRDPAA